jgi:predicted nuclease with TOPRIM domain
MARTKEQRTIQRGRRANELAAVAQCMDGWLRRRAEGLSNQVEELQAENCNLLSYATQMERVIETAVERIQRRDRRIVELEQNFEEMAQALHNALEDLEQYRNINRTLTEQVLDCSCFEKENME